MQIFSDICVYWFCSPFALLLIPFCQPPTWLREKYGGKNGEALGKLRENFGEGSGKVRGKNGKGLGKELDEGGEKKYFQK